MCLGGGGSSVSDSGFKDTSEDPIVSKYELTAEQKAENKRRIALKKSKSLINESGDGKSESLAPDMGVGQGIGKVGDASGGMARV